MLCMYSCVQVHNVYYYYICDGIRYIRYDVCGYEVIYPRIKYNLKMYGIVYIVLD